jgi:hypothetical protein
MDNNENKNMPVTPQQTQDLDSQLTEFPGVKVQGHIKIFDPETQEVYVNKRNAIHYENFSLALVNSVANMGYGMITNMSFGNGGSRVDPTGIITYLTPNSIGQNATLYNETYTKIIDASSTANLDPTRNFMETRHVLGNTYTDLLVSCLLDFGEPSGQNAFDNSSNLDGKYVFDELGLKGYDAAGNLMLLTHVIFHPVQKSLNRMIQIDYTIRVQSISGVGA